jgi:HD-GYP domain-containing protein (c-di-GMP phosphodiesterase class II)
MQKSASRHELNRDSHPAVRIPDVISGLSCGLDLAEGYPEGHAIRTCLIGMRIARELRIDDAERSVLFDTLLLKDLGGSANASKICHLFGANDRTVKQHLKTVDWANLAETVRFMSRNVMPDGAPLQRILRAVVFALEGPDGPRKLIQTRSQHGSDLARRLGLAEATAVAIGQVDERWDGRGHPAGLKQDELSLCARITSVAQSAECALAAGGLAAALQVARDRRGTWYDPSIVDALLATSGDNDFWVRVAAAEPHAELAGFEPEQHALHGDEATLDRIARVFSDVVDGKSPWTFRHSTGVAQIAVGIAKALGLSESALSRIHRAGLLHDIGKLAVSNLILDKPGNLTSEEYVELRRHPRYTHQILDRIAAFHDIAEMAATHHERLDGRGYHRGIRATDLPIESRLMVVADICEALSAKRPYRDALPRERVHEILAQDAGTAVCPECVEALKTYHDQDDTICRVNAQLEELDRVLQGI